MQMASIWRSLATNRFAFLVTRPIPRLAYEYTRIPFVTYRGMCKPHFRFRSRQTTFRSKLLRWLLLPGSSSTTSKAYLRKRYIAMVIDSGSLPYGARSGKQSKRDPDSVRIANSELQYCAFRGQFNRENTVSKILSATLHAIDRECSRSFHFVLIKL